MKVFRRQDSASSGPIDPQPKMGSSPPSLVLESAVVSQPHTGCRARELSKWKGLRLEAGRLCRMSCRAPFSLGSSLPWARPWGTVCLLLRRCGGEDGSKRKGRTLECGQEIKDLEAAFRKGVSFLPRSTFLIVFTVFGKLKKVAFEDTTVTAYSDQKLTNSP